MYNIIVIKDVSSNGPMSFLLHSLSTFRLIPIGADNIIIVIIEFLRYDNSVTFKFISYLKRDVF